MTILNIRHKTTYLYNQPVNFGEHRLMCRPRDSHDLRIITTTLAIDPRPHTLRWIHDVFGNSIAIGPFDQSAPRPPFGSAFRGGHDRTAPGQSVVAPYATRFA